MASSLTQADVARLLAEPSTAARAELADKLAREIDNTQLTAAELRIAHDVVRIMAQDVELAVRRALSHSLRSAAQLPHDIALRLASDVEAVALPILINSPVLSDADLVALVNGGSAPKQEAIAGRPEVSEQVSDALVTKGSETAVASSIRLPNNSCCGLSTRASQKRSARWSCSTGMTTETGATVKAM